MIAVVAVSIATLVGQWFCSSPSDSWTGKDIKYKYVFSNNATGYLQRFESGRGRPPGTFDYELNGGYLFETLKEPGRTDMVTRHIYKLNGNHFEDLGWVYWHEGHWTTPSMEDRYYCTRSRRAGS